MFNSVNVPNSILDNYSVIQWLNDLYHSVGADQGIGFGSIITIISMFVITDRMKNNRNFVITWNTIAVILLALAAGLWVMNFSGWINVENVLGDQYYYAGKVRKMTDGTLKANGYGRQFDLDENLIYRGEFRMNNYHGKGTLYLSDGRRYEGEFSDGLRNGTGTQYWPDGGRYEGEWANDVRNGTGTDYWPDGQRYEGEYADGVRNGTGTYYYLDGRRYEGEWADGFRSGTGILYWPDGSKYTGIWENGVKHGKGVYTFPDGIAEAQEYANGVRVS